MPVLSWRPREPKPPAASALGAHQRVAGAYAGRVRFRPVDLETLPPVLRSAVGRVVKVGYAGLGQPGDPFTGQALYLEWNSDEVFDGFLIPEQDLEFLGA